MTAAVQTSPPSDHGLAQASLPVEGMHCTGCAQSIQMGLGTVPGVASAAVSYAAGQAEVQFDPRQVSLGSLAGAVADLGYAVPRTETELTIGGMTCTGCVQAVQQALNGTDGVLEASVSLTPPLATVAYLPEVTGPEALAASVDRAGYDAALPAISDVPGTAEEDREQAASLDPELRGRRRRLVTAIACSAVIMLLNMTAMFLPNLQWMPTATREWTVAVLGSIVVLAIGREFHVRAVQSLRRGFPGMDLLVSLGSLVAWGTSLATLLLDLDRALFPLFFESAAFIITFIYLGRYLEAGARRQTGEAISALMTLQPAKAIVERGGRHHDVPLAELAVGDTVLVRAGDTIPVDGTVLDGSSSVDEAVLTGESLPVPKSADDAVWSGTVNLDGTLRFRADAVGSETAAARIADTVRQALMSQAPVQSLADRIARVFVPIIVVLATICGLIWGFWGASQYYPDLAPASVSLIFASAVLLISCPCALGLATPTAMIAGTSLGARRGILVKDAGYAAEAVDHRHRIAGQDRHCDPRPSAAGETGAVAAGHPGPGTDSVTRRRRSARQCPSRCPGARRRGGATGTAGTAGGRLPQPDRTGRGRHGGRFRGSDRQPDAHGPARVVHRRIRGIAGLGGGRLSQHLLCCGRGSGGSLRRRFGFAAPGRQPTR